MSVTLDLIGLVVRDMRATVTFYRRLGLVFPEGSEDEGHVETRAGGLRVALDALDVIRSFDPDFEPAEGAGRVGLAFLCSSPAEVDARYAELTAAGHAGHKAPWDAFWGQRYAQVKDPDGNTVDLFAPLPGA